MVSMKELLLCVTCWQMKGAKRSKCIWKHQVNFADDISCAIFALCAQRLGGPDTYTFTHIPLPLQNQ